jgi:NADPH-dependent F420 reductase
MIGFIGGTGNQGRALALRIAAAGNEVILGSRSLEKARKVVKKIDKRQEGLRIRPVTNEEAAKEAEIVFVTLPYRSMKSTVEPLEEYLRGKIVVDVINPIKPRNVCKGVSASEELQAMLKGSKVVCAFKNVSSSLIWNLDEKVDVDSIVCGESEDAKKEIIKLSEEIGIPSVDGGGIENALASELLTSLLLDLNKKYKAETGIKIKVISHRV